MEPLIAPVSDFTCPSSWVSNPQWISHLHSFLLVCGDPEFMNLNLYKGLGPRKGAAKVGLASVAVRFIHDTYGN